MTTEEERCAQARKFERIDTAFKLGDLEGLRAAVDDPAAIPNGPMPLSIGPCLVYAIYRSPIAFIRTLLALGADPNAPVDDGFPPLIAALSCTRDAPGAGRRTDADEVLRLLLASGADPNQRGINDYTALHMAVAERNAAAVRILLDSGADPELRTRIDDCETPLEMARGAGLSEISEMISEHGRPSRRRLRSGLWLLAEVLGEGEPVAKRHNYLIRLRMWLNRGEPVRWQSTPDDSDRIRLEDDRTTLFSEVRFDRRSVVSGFCYGVQGMRVGGMRRLEIAPHLAYGKRGVPGVIPPGAVLTAEITILEAR